MGSRTARAGGAALALALVAGLGAGCTGEPDPQETADQVGQALVRRDLSGVPLDGVDAATATTQLRTLLEGLGERRPTVSLADDPGPGDQDAATARYRVSWPLWGDQRWDYETTVPLVKKDGRWLARWTPAAAVPRAQAGDAVVVTRTPAIRGRVLGAGGTPIVVPRPVVRVGVDKGHVTAAQAVAAAPRVSRLVGLEDAAAYTRRVQQAGPQAFVEAVVLRRDDPLLTKVGALAAAVPGVGEVDADLPLPPTRTFARPVLGTVGEATAEIVDRSDGEVRPGDLVGTAGLQRAADATLRGTPGVTLALRRGEATVPLRTTRPVPGTDLVTTLDVAAQTRAEALLAGVVPASALVAIRPSTGDVLAAASGPGGQGQPTATLGAYAPGSTFKIVSTLALLRGGLTPRSPVACTTDLVVDGRRFENYDAYPADGLGTVPLATAFAKSCNTAFIAERGRATGPRLAEAAAALGMTGTPSLGVEGYLGKVPDAQGETDQAARMIGQGEITASPLGMAAVAASVAAGRRVSPRLVVPAGGPGSTAPATTNPTTNPTTSPTAAPDPAPAHPLKPAEATALRSLMRGVVTGGSGALLAPLPGEVGAKTGTAEFGTSTPPQKHAWMVATRGDLAVAVFVDTGEGGSRTAGPILEAFLRGTR